MDGGDLVALSILRLALLLLLHQVSGDHVELGVPLGLGIHVRVSLGDALTAHPLVGQITNAVGGRAPCHTSALAGAGRAHHLNLHVVVLSPGGLSVLVDALVHPAVRLLRHAVLHVVMIRVLRAALHVHRVLGYR